jgi:hypothetical protein
MISPPLTLPDHQSGPDAPPEAGLHHYRVLGLTVASDRIIPGLGRAVPGSASADVLLTTLGIPAWLVGKAAAAPDPTYVSPIVTAGVPALQTWTLDGGAFVRLRHWDGINCFVEQSGAHVWVDWPREPHADPLEFLLGFVIAYIRRLHGVVCLHAAVVCGRHGVALAGRSGVGKSTLAAALSMRGFPVLTDDVAAIVVGEDNCLVHPGPSRIRVRQCSLDQLIPLRRGGTTWNLSPGGDYADLDLSQPGLQPAEPIELGSICFLEPQALCEKPTLATMPAVDALVTLVGDAWATRLLDRRARAQEFDVVGRIARAPLCRMTYERNSAWVQDACQLLERSLLAGDLSGVSAA